MKLPNLFIGPMSKNVVDSVINFSNDHNIVLGLIPSRRQIDFAGGYVNNWTTRTFAQYVRERTESVVLVRDHGGPGQGDVKDYGWDSFYEDAVELDMIHIDPWKESVFESAKEKTSQYIKFCYNRNPKVNFEIGTEEAIQKYEADQLDELISYLKSNLSAEQYQNIKYAVIQSGTSIKNGVNTGIYSKSRLQDMIAVCKNHDLLSKEHNGDYLEGNLIKEKFGDGLYSINIAPEFGQIETNTILELIKERNRSDLFTIFYQLCFESGRWKKWINGDPFPEDIIKASGHYVFSHPRFGAIKNSLSDIDALSQEKMKQRLTEILL